MLKVRPIANIPGIQNRHCNKNRVRFCKNIFKKLKTIVDSNLLKFWLRNDDFLEFIETKKFFIVRLLFMAVDIKIVYVVFSLISESQTSIFLNIQNYSSQNKKVLFILSEKARMIRHSTPGIGLSTACFEVVDVATWYIFF